MGNFKRKKCGLLIPLLAFSLLTGCEGLERQVLDYDNVKDILSVVDSTLESPIYDNDDHETSFGFGYDYLFNQYTSQDYVGTTPRDFDYYDEPFIQFKYVKYILQNEGIDFKFGTKYYDTQTKSVYFDFLNNVKDESRDLDYKVVCNMIIGADVRVNAFNQICANVVFQNSYTLPSSGVAFTTNRYVNFLIDYDFTAEEPTFILKAYTRNDELSAPYVGYMTYQYDYIRVVNSLLVEYRKFNVETSAALTPDENHGSFESYVNDGIAYRVDSLKWYVDGIYRSSRYMSQAKQLDIGSALFELGMFEPFSYADFLANLEDNQVTNTSNIYTTISNKRGDDIQYAFLTKNDSMITHINEQNNPYYDPEAMYPDLVDEIRVCTSAGYAVPNYVVGSTTTIRSLYTGFEDLSSSTYVTIPVCYLSKGKVKEQIASSSLTNTSLFEMSFRVFLKDGTTTSWQKMNNSYTIKQAYQIVDETIPLDYENLTDVFSIMIVDETKGLWCDYWMTYGESLAFLKKNTTFPEELINYGVPQYTSTTVTSYELLDTGRYENGYACTITRTSISDLDTYENYLFSNSFYVYYDSGNTLTYPTRIYAKPINSTTNLFIKLSYTGKKNNSLVYLLRTYRVKWSDQSNLTSVFPNELRLAGFPTYETTNGSFDLQTDGLYIYNSNYTELNKYINKLQSSYGYAQMANNSYDGYVVYIKNNDTTSLKVYQLTFFYYQQEHKEFYVKLDLIDNPNYVESFELTSLYMTNTFDTWNSSIASSSVRFVNAGGNEWFLESQTFLLAGREFKFIANDDWNVCNKGSSYKGFGYDDVDSMSSMTSYFYRGSDGKIVTKINMILNITCYVTSAYKLEFIFNVTPIGSIL